MTQKLQLPKDGALLEPNTLALMDQNLPSYQTATAPAELELEQHRFINTAIGVQSYQPTQQMTVLSASRNPKNLPMGLDGTRSFSIGLCDCCQTPRLAALACLCPCIVYGSNRRRLQHLTAHGSPHPNPGSCGIPCILYALSPQVLGIGQIILQAFGRFQIRQRYRVRGDCAMDTAIAAFCTCCTLVQESREMGEEEEYLRAIGEAEPVEAVYRDNLPDVAHAA